MKLWEKQFPSLNKKLKQIEGQHLVRIESNNMTQVPLSNTWLKRHFYTLCLNPQGVFVFIIDNNYSNEIPK